MLNWLSCGYRYSIGDKPLNNRLNIVLQAEGAIVAKTLEEAFQIGKQEARKEKRQLRYDIYDLQKMLIFKFLVDKIRK